jgi:hypothetical protein
VTTHPATQPPQKYNNKWGVGPSRAVGEVRLRAEGRTLKLQR